MYNPTPTTHQSTWNDDDAIFNWVNILLPLAQSIQFTHVDEYHDWVYNLPQLGGLRSSVVSGVRDELLPYITIQP